MPFERSFFRVPFMKSDIQVQSHRMGIRKMKRQDEDDDGVGKGDEIVLMRDAVERLAHRTH